MKNLIAILLASAALIACASGQSASTNGVAGQAGSNDLAAYARMNRRELELSTQLKLLTDVAEELLKRAEDAKAAAPDRAKWQSDLALELRDRASNRLKELNQATADRLAWEASHGGAASNPPLGVGALDQGKPLNAEEVAYVSKLDERTLIVRQELAAALDYGKTFSAQLATNSSPDEVSRISGMVDRNNAAVKFLERDHADLELRKLEFRALRR